jgi:asparagine synthase (glutamine-hydrolysing)
LIEQLRTLLIASVRRRLVSDVPLGIFLSGGVDSATVLACAAQLRPAASISTFTVGFTEPSYDESEAAGATASAFGTAHHVSRVELERANVRAIDTLQRLDEPLGDASLIPTHLLCQFARESVTVALSGDGGDELFAGYDPIRALGPASIYSRLVPPMLHGWLRTISNHLPKRSGYMSWDFRLRRALTGLSYPAPYWNPVWMAPIEPAAMGQFFDDPLAPEELYEEAITAWRCSGQTDFLSRTLEFFTMLYLQNDILTKVDRASMMVSLESRAVFLDPALVDFCRMLPNRWKYRNGERKYLLKRALKGLVPDAVLARRKQGFGPPLQSWLSRLAAPRASNMIPGLKDEAFREQWDRNRRGKSDDRLLLWNWFALETWAANAAPQRQEVVVQ